MGEGKAVSLTISSIPVLLLCWFLQMSYFLKQRSVKLGKKKKKKKRCFRPKYWPERIPVVFLR